jgi:sugar phosphate isomerase/epimerase
MTNLNRRAFLQKTGQGALIAGVLAGDVLDANAAETKPRKMTADLVCGNLGISANQNEAIDLAARHGFESVGVDAGYVAALNASQVEELKSNLKNKNLVWGAANLPTDFRGDDAHFESSLAMLPEIAASLQRAGVLRVSTWLSPSHNQLTYIQNFRRHASRLRRVAAVLADSNIRFGMEYVAPKTLWASGRYPFIHTLAEMQDLLAEMNAPNAGIVLDSWHWWHAGNTCADILALQGRDVIAVDLNDAPTGVPKDQMPDNHRELPCATGVIDLGGFLSALNEIGYDGPVRAEPFNQTVNHMPKDDACEAAAVSIKKAFALIH